MIEVPGIADLGPRLLIGLSRNMSILNNSTSLLWQEFMPFRKSISGRLNDELFSLQVYDPLYFKLFDPRREFTKWAAVEISEPGSYPERLEKFELVGGRYAIFHYKGHPADTKIFEYIYREWLPKSGYNLDQRPHFEIIGSHYKHNSPDSEEDIYIPIKPVG